MLPLWRDAVVAYVAPRRIALQRWARGLRRTLAASLDVTLDARSGDAFPAAFARLSELLADSQWQSADAQVILSDHWVRYATVPAPAVTLDADGRLSHARYVLADRFGDSLAQWTLALTDSPPGQPYVACATPAPMRTELGDLFASAQLNLTSLQPQLVVSFNTWRHRLPAAESWFITVDHGSLAAVHVLDGVWHRVHTARLSADWWVEIQRLRALGTLIERETGSLGVFIDAPTDLRDQGRRELSELEWLEPSARQENLPMLRLLKRVVA